MTAKKIAIDARRLRNTTGRVARELLNELQDIDTTNEYHVIIHVKDKGQWEPKNKNFKLHVVTQDHYTFSEQISFAYFLYKLKVDLVHFTMPQQPILYFKPHVNTVHDLTLVKHKNIDGSRLVYFIRQTVFKAVLRRVCKKAKRIITITEYVKQDINDYYGVDPNQITIAQPAADAIDAKPVVFKLAKGKDYVMYVGNAFPYKNLWSLVEAHQQLLLKRPKLHLFLVGKPDHFYNELEERVAKNQYQNVHFTGFVTEGELVWLYKNAKAYVFPSLSEGFGMPGLEAMQFSLPVVSSNATCLPEVYGDAAHYFDPQSVDEMAVAVDEVLKSSALRKKLVTAGKKRNKLYSWKKMSETIHETYMDVLS